MNSEKWRTIALPKELIEDLIAAHLYNMRGMNRREIVEVDVSSFSQLEMIPIKIKMKEEVSQKTSRLNDTDAEMAR